MRIDDVQPGTSFLFKLASVQYVGFKVSGSSHSNPGFLALSPGHPDIGVPGFLNDAALDGVFVIPISAKIVMRLETSALASQDLGAELPTGSLVLAADGKLYIWAQMGTRQRGLVECETGLPIIGTASASRCVAFARWSIAAQDINGKWHTVCEIKAV